ncbi:MAG TPA: hypothetical protein VKN14_09685 [Flavobacteriaceae bacterium]|nr:hypothetical protein [Flavobacteriaceae bacterium]
MKRLLFFFLIVVLTNISCDGRDRAHKSNQEVLKENKLLDSFSENTVHIPETYTEIKTDTILSNGTKIEIKLYSDMDVSVLKTFKKDAIQYKEYYRDFNAHIIVYKNNLEIFNEIINKEFLNNSLVASVSLHDATLKNVQIDEMTSYLDNLLVIDLTFAKLDNVVSSVYKIYIEDTGKFILREQLNKEYV